MSTTSAWTVAGMTCGHCVASVTEELQEVGACVDSSSRARVSLSRAIDKSLAKMRSTRSPCAKG